MSRTLFTLFLQRASTNSSVNQFTLQVVSLMNDQMVRKGVPMSKDHLEVAQRSIERGDGLYEFLKAENKHVLASTGEGAVYQAGRLFHKLVLPKAMSIENAVKCL